MRFVLKASPSNVLIGGLVPNPPVVSLVEPPLKACGNDGIRIGIFYNTANQSGVTEIHLKSSNYGAAEVELKSPFVPLFSKGEFSPRDFNPPFGKEGKGRFSNEMTRRLYYEFWGQDTGKNRAQTLNQNPNTLLVKMAASIY